MSKKAPAHANAVSSVSPPVRSSIDALSGTHVPRDTWKLALERATDAQLLIEPFEGLVLYSNEAADRLFDKPYGSVIGRLALHLYPDARGKLLVLTQEALEQGTAIARNLSLLRPDGAQRRLEHRASRIDIAEQRLLMLSIVDLDQLEYRAIQDDAELFYRKGVTEWRKAEHYFRELERDNQMILAAAGDGIYGVNADGVASFVNPAAERMLGYSADELVGQELHSIIHHHKPDGTVYANLDCPIYAAFRRGAVQTVDDEVFWRKDGTALRVEYVSTPILDNETVVGAVVSFRDITERKKAEETLQRAWQENALLRERLEQENAYLLEEIRTHSKHEHIHGSSQAIAGLLQQIELVADTDASVLITGESGTGKELVARAIHDASSRRERPLIRVNCAAVARELFESEFFGHVKGAFSGAMRDRIGRFELADGGTLFLDEVGEIPLDLQSKLLRVLQDRRFERVGDERTRHVDVRVIAATNRDLKNEVSQGRFREDLYFRLNVFPIECLPLRERTDDIPPLATRFMETSCRNLKREQRTLTRANIAELMAYHWPGNARELQNVIERALIVAGDGKLRFELPHTANNGAKPRTASDAAASAPPPILTADELRQLERHNLQRALDACGGRVAGERGAAALLGMRPTTLYSRLKALEIGGRIR